MPVEPLLHRIFRRAAKAIGNAAIEMNRRSFLSSMLRAGAAFAVLPPAITYARQWKPTASGIYVLSDLDRDRILLKVLEDFAKQVVDAMVNEVNRANAAHARRFSPLRPFAAICGPLSSSPLNVR